jgi:hypothetical protein
MKQHAMAVLWPAFLMAGVLEVLTFAVLDPGEMHWFGGAPVELSRQAVYTLTFLIFWVVISTAAALSVLLLATPGETGRSDQNRWPG